MAFTQTLVLGRGVSETLIDAATVVGVDRSQRFCIQPAPGGGTRVLEYHAPVVPATALVASLEESQDGGVTFNVRQAAIDIFANRAGRIDVNPGCIYRFNITTFTGAGTATLKGALS